MINTTPVSPQTYARIAGICYLAIILLGAFGQIFIRDSLVVHADAAATAANIKSHASLWRVGIFVDILMHLFDIPVMVIIYTLLKPVNRSIALSALVFNIIQTASLIVNKLNLFLPVIMVGNVEHLQLFEQQLIHAQIMWLLDLHRHGFALGLVFFGFACLCYGYLIFHSGYFPKLIGTLIVVAGASYLTYSLTLILAPQFSGYTLPILVFCLIGELSFCLWLIFKGVNLQEWNKKFSGASS